MSLAAGSFERTHGLKLRALGLDKDLPISDELPVLTFRDLSDDEIKARQHADDEDEVEPFVLEAPNLATQGQDDEPIPEEDDDIVVEEGEQPAMEAEAVARDADGHRLVRGAHS